MKQKLVIFSFLILTNLLIAGKNPVSVPLDNKIYRFLDRMETLGILDNIRDGIKPLSRGRISNYLVQINGQRTQLTAIDREHLDNYLLDFRFETNKTEKYAQIRDKGNIYSPFMSWNQFKHDFNRFFQQNQPEEDNHLFLWEDSAKSFYFDFIFGLNYYNRSDDKKRWNQWESYQFRGSFSDYFGYMLNVSFFRFYGDKEYREQDPLLNNSWRNSREDVTYLDRSGGDLALGSEYVDFHLSYMPTTWGVGESGQMIVSDNVEPFPYVSLEANWNWGTFKYMHGKLMGLANGDSIDGQPVYPDKYLVINRFEFSPIKSMSVGLNGMIIYGNRGFEWAYLLPFSYLRATEHNLKDRDNALLAIDLEARIWQGIKVYGTFLIDELKKSELFTDWYGNKHGFQIGTHFSDPLGLDNVSLRFEYAAIMPWVYTHKYNINRYMSDSSALGHWAGPNSEIIYINLEKEWHRRLRMGLRYMQWKHGDNYPDENIGGNILYGHNILFPGQDKPRTTRKFLEGILTTVNRFELFTEYEILNDLYLNLVVSKLITKNEASDQDLTEVHFGLKLEY